MVPVRHTLTEMGWHQPTSPIQCDKSTAAGMKNSTLVPRKSKYWYLRLNWLQCIESQNQFRYYWDKGSNNWDDYSKTHHPTIYHETKRSLRFVGCVYYPELYSFFSLGLATEVPKLTHYWVVWFHPMHRIPKSIPLLLGQGF